MTLFSFDKKMREKMKKNERKMKCFIAILKAKQKVRILKIQVVRNVLTPIIVMKISLT
jgi:hypothetical protein